MSHTESGLSRRQLLQAAGGLTFLAAAPADAHDDTAPEVIAPAPPLFTALPYLQPGPDNDTSLVVAWQTNDRPADFAVTIEGRAPVVPERRIRMSGDDGELRYNYAAHLKELSAGRRYRYRVSLGGEEIAEGWFTARKGRRQRTRFVAFGDNSYGDISDRMIAYQAFRARPDFLLNTGDTVYEDGTDSQYARHFFPIYNADATGPRIGAPLLRSVPLYSVIANHDVHGKNEKKEPVADFVINPDSLAFFTNLYLPLNGFAGGPTPPMMGPEKPIAHFKACAGARFPAMTNYRFDYGEGFFLCLDSNVYVDPNDPALQKYVEESLKASDAAWRFVVFHHPCFNVGEEHYAQQHMRVLAPIFERCGVDLVFHGHEHNYQRTVPMRFAPTDTKAASVVGSKVRLVPGRFELDRRFDGHRRTQPDGVIYVTTGAGGKSLYEREWGQTAKTHPEDGHLDYIARFVSDRHSLTVIDMDERALTLTQIDQWGRTIDRCRITKKS